MEVASSSKTAGTNIQQNIYKGITSQQWNVSPVDTRIGGDFSYFKIINKNSGMVPDVLNFSLDNGANILQWDDNSNSNQQWYLEYNEDGWFFIKNRESAYCLEVVNSSTVSGANIQQWKQDGAPNQQWRFIPVGAPVEFVPPRAPAGLSATAQSASVLLAWDANSEDDVAGYNVYRADASDGDYNTIARTVDGTSFVDNTVLDGETYYYKIKAIDNSLNTSDYSIAVSSAATSNHALIVNYKFEDNTLDDSENLDHGAAYQDMDFAEGKVGSKAIVFDGNDDFIQLSPTVANHKEMTIATWIYWEGSSSSQYVFDFGNNRDERMFLSPNVFYNKLRFGIENNDGEQRLESSALAKNTWIHVAVVLGEGDARLYVDGALVDEATDITISPLDIKPVLNYLGRGQSDGDRFEGQIDDFRIYNYALTTEEVNQIIEDPNLVNDIELNISTWPNPATDVLHVNYYAAESAITSISVLAMNGSEVLQMNVDNAYEADVNVSDLAAGVYTLKMTSGSKYVLRKFVVCH